MRTRLQPDAQQAVCSRTACVAALVRCGPALPVTHSHLQEAQRDAIHI